MLAVPCSSAYTLRRQEAKGLGVGFRLQQLRDGALLPDRITIDPDPCNGRPTIRGKRIAAQSILEYLAAGETREEILRQYPSLEPEDIDACVAFAASARARHHAFTGT